MKKTLCVNLFLMVFLLNSNCLYAEDVWRDNFANETGKGYWGGGSDMLDVTTWSLNTENCLFEDEGDYVKVVSTNGGRLEAKDCDGEAIWKIMSIDIADFTDVEISLYAAETGSSTNTDKYVKCFYILDEGVEIPFETNAENIGNWDNVIALQSGLNGSSLQVIVRLNNPNSGDAVYIKDVLISGTAIVPERDQLTLILPSQTPIENNMIGTTANKPSLAAPIFRFKLDETAEASDSFPTKISKLTFYNSNPDNGMNWENGIGGISLYSEDIELIPNIVQFDSDSVWMEFLEGQIDIPNAESREFELRVYLDTIHTIIDGENFQLHIKENAIGFETFNSGSSFSSQSNVLSSAIHTIDVNASRIHFANLQDTIIRNHQFSIFLMAADEYNNLDVDAEEEVNLFLENGSGELVSATALSQSFVRGELHFDALQYSEVETISLTASGIVLGEWTSADIVVENTMQTHVAIDSSYASTKVLSSLWIQEENAFEVYRFTITDSGEDNLPTIFQKIRLIGSSTNQVDWERSIDKFSIKRDNEILDVNFDLDNSELIIQFLDEESGREVANESTATYSIFCYFKKGKCIDGEILQVAIDSLHSNWEISESGSGLLPVFENNLLGPKFTINVEPEKMVFTDTPKFINFQEEFELGIELTDRYGNVNLDFDAEIRLSLATGNGELFSGNLNSIRQAEHYLWSDLVYSKAEIFTIQAECDDFPTILSDNISAVDRNSLIGSADPIESLELNPLVIDQQNAIAIFSFQITDSGTHDRLPTLLSNLKFCNSYPENSFDWKKHIAGAVLKSSEEIIATTSNIEDDYIRFSSAQGIVAIENGLTKEFTLGIYFRKGNLPDLATIQIEIPSENHEWKTVENGSALSNEMQKQNSSIHQIQVQETKYAFLSAPFAIENSQDKFSLRIGACDAHNNIDLDANEDIELSLENGNGELIFTDQILSIENGTLVIDSIQYTENDHFKIGIDANLESEVVQIFSGEDELNINENFELRDLNLWQNTDAWKVSTYRAINGNYSLKHNLTSEIGASHISIPLTDVSPNSGAIQWSFVIRNGDWDPSAGNKFVFHLLMDHSNPENATEKYSVGVNLKGSNDLLSLWNTNQENEIDLLLESDLNWEENEAIAIQVKYYPDGRWELAYNRLGEQNNWLKAGHVYSEVKLKSADWFSTLYFSFESSSRAGYLWFDDLKMEAINTAPFLQHHQFIGQDSIKLIYSEDLNFEKSALQENFTVKRDEQILTSFSVHQGNSNKELILKFGANLLTGEYSFDILNICDAKGAVQKKEFFQAIYFAPAKKHELVINEIMADESPFVGLPEFEYIELYNKLEYPVSLKNWKLKINDREIELDSARIEAESYLILCANTAVEDFQEFGSVLGVVGFSGLTNSESVLEIISAEGVVIDQIHYFSSWHQPVGKENGGWSLERMDPNNTAWQQNNWSSSVNENGGTPGELNSIYSIIVDLDAPLILACNLLEENCIRLVFSEPINEIAVTNIANYQLSDNTPIYKIEQADFNAFEFHLFISNELNANQQYELILSDEIKDLAGNSLAIRQYEFWVADEIAQGDVIINEVLFNPYPNGSDYVEIFNVSEKIIDLKDVKLGTRGDNYQLIDTLPFSNDYLHPKEYLLITTDTLNVSNNYFTSNTNVFCQAKSLPIFDDKTGRVVLNSQNIIIDDFEYNEEMHFALLASFSGVALERLDPLEETNKTANWQSAAQNIGFGSPGLQNSVYKEFNSQSTEVSLSSKVFSPDNDGIDDRLMINFKLKEDGYLASVRIYNSLGLEVRKLATNITLANEDALFWDGLSSRKMRVPIGIYLVYIELFNLEGEIDSYKIPCVLGGKFK